MYPAGERMAITIMALSGKRRSNTTALIGETDFSFIARDHAAS
jgi:hypothetical protein